MPNDFKYDVFLSHSAKDKPVVRELANRLKKDNLRVWFDEWELKPGDNIPAKIEEGLEGSRVLVLCMSANAFGSEWVQLEAGTFRFRDPLNKERRFIPLRLDDASIEVCRLSEVPLVAEGYATQRQPRGCCCTKKTAFPLFSQAVRERRRHHPIQQPRWSTTILRLRPLTTTGTNWATMCLTGGLHSFATGTQSHLSTCELPNTMRSSNEVQQNTSDLH